MIQCPPRSRYTRCSASWRRLSLQVRRRVRSRKSAGAPCSDTPKLRMKCLKGSFLTEPCTVLTIWGVTRHVVVCAPRAPRLFFAIMCECTRPSDPDMCMLAPDAHHHTCLDRALLLMRALITSPRVGAHLISSMPDCVHHALLHFVCPCRPLPSSPSITALTGLTMIIDSREGRSRITYVRYR